MDISFLEDPFMHQLLMCDVILVGSIVRELQRPGFVLRDFYEHSVVVGQCPLLAKPYLERVLFTYLKRSRIEYTSMVNTVVFYDLHHPKEKDLLIRLRIAFYKIDQQEFPKVDLDVNALSLSRGGLMVDPLFLQHKPVSSINPPFSSIPSPFTSILTQIRDKTFNIVQPDSDMMWKTKRAQLFIDRGWTYSGSALCLLDEDEVPDDTCSICTQPLITQTCFRTRCGHAYHGGCWQEYVRKKIFGDMVSLLTCPLCRHQIMCYEALLPVQVK